MFVFLANDALSLQLTHRPANISLRQALSEHVPNPIYSVVLAWETSEDSDTPELSLTSDPEFVFCKNASDEAPRRPCFFKFEFKWLEKVVDKHDKHNAKTKSKLLIYTFLSYSLI